MAKTKKIQADPQTFTISTNMIWGTGHRAMHLKTTIIRLLHTRCPHATQAQRERFVEDCIKNGAIKEAGSVNGMQLYSIDREYSAEFRKI